MSRPGLECWPVAAGLLNFDRATAPGSDYRGPISFLLVYWRFTVSVPVETYVRVLEFYAHQMRLLDALDVSGYTLTFAVDGVTDHAHRNEVVTGREALHQTSVAALPRYAGTTPRHWNDHYVMEVTDRGVLVQYNSLVTKTDRSNGSVAFESTFSVHDELVHDGQTFLVQRRTIHQDRDYAPVPKEPALAGV